MGVTLGFHLPIKRFGAVCGADGCAQAVLDPLAAATHGGQFFRAAAAQQRQQRRAEPLRREQQAVRRRVPVKLFRFTGHIGFHTGHAVFLHRSAQETGRSDLYLPGPAGRLRPMPGPQPRQRAGLHIAFLAQQRFAVLNPQDVVGAAQQFPAPRQHCLQGGRPGRRKSLALRQTAAQFRLQRRLVQQAGSFQQAGGVGRLGAERQRIAAKRAEKMYPGRGEILRPGAGIRPGQRHNQVCPGLQRRLHPHGLRQQRHTAALHRPAAHAHGDGLRPAGAQHGQLGRVAVVEGVIFRNDADKVHKLPFCTC